MLVNVTVTFHIVMDEILKWFHYLSGSVSPGLTQREGQEKTLVIRMGHMINAFHELSQSAVPVGTCIDSVIKGVTRLYGALTLITKYVSTGIC